MFAIVAEAEAGKQEAEIAALLDLAFGPGRLARTAYRLREGRAPVAGLGFVALGEAGGEAKPLLGSIRYWPVRIGAADALLLGPLAVHPQHQGEGIGLGLMRHSLAAAEALEWSGVLLVGDLPYYERVGFGPAAPGRVAFPGPVDAGRLLWRGFGASELPEGEVRAGGV